MKVCGWLYGARPAASRVEIFAELGRAPTASGVSLALALRAQAMEFEPTNEGAAGRWRDTVSLAFEGPDQELAREHLAAGLDPLFEFYRLLPDARARIDQGSPALAAAYQRRLLDLDAARPAGVGPRRL